MKKKSIIYLLILLSWCFIIYLFSDTPSKESNQASKKLIELSTIEVVKITNDLKITKIDINNKKWRNNTVNKLNVPLRKIVHGLIYFVLGIIIYLLLISFGVDRKSAILWTIALCFIYSTTDEIHQTFVFERSGRITDCLIDTLGSILGSLLIYKIYSLRKSITT